MQPELSVNILTNRKKFYYAVSFCNIFELTAFFYNYHIG